MVNVEVVFVEEALIEGCAGASSIFPTRGGILKDNFILIHTWNIIMKLSYTREQRAVFGTRPRHKSITTCVRLGRRVSSRCDAITYLIKYACNDKERFFMPLFMQIRDITFDYDTGGQLSIMVN